MSTRQILHRPFPKITINGEEISEPEVMALEMAVDLFQRNVGRIAARMKEPESVANGQTYQIFAELLMDRLIGELEEARAAAKKGGGTPR